MKVHELIGGGSRIVEKPPPVDDPKRRRPNIAAAQGLLGWSPRVPLTAGSSRPSSGSRPICWERIRPSGATSAATGAQRGVPAQARHGRPETLHRPIVQHLPGSQEQGRLEARGMHDIIYIVGLIVVVMFILSALGLR